MRLLLPFEDGTPFVFFISVSHSVNRAQTRSPKPHRAEQEALRQFTRDNVNRRIVKKNICLF